MKFEEGDRVIITKAISQPYVKAGEVWALLFKDPNQEWWGQKSEFETKFLLMRDQVEFAHFTTMEAELLDNYIDECPYLLSIREYIGVFEAPRSWMQANLTLDDAKEERDFWKNEVGDGCTIFKIPVWPKRRKFKNPIWRGRKK